MRIHGTPYRSIWPDPAAGGPVLVLDQRKLPHALEVLALQTWEETAEAIRNMTVRGAPLIGATAAFGMYLAGRAARPASFASDLRTAGEALMATRPTAKDLEWAVRRQWAVVAAVHDPAVAIALLREEALRVSEASVADCRRIGEYGLAFIEDLYRRHPGRPVNILTHCNAGWLACVDYGTATAPIYLAHDAGIPVHVWVDETRPRNQGASLTAWELGGHGVPHTLIVDNAGGHLMQHGKVDLVITGADRITRCGDAANKIGTYLKALAARDNGVPFYIAAPASTFDAAMRDGVREIPIEERDAREVTHMAGDSGSGVAHVRICPPDTPVSNYGFDVTPARLITGIITERGVAEASEGALLRLFPEWAAPGAAS